MTRIAIPNRCMIGNCLLYLAEFEAALAETGAALALARKVANPHAEMFALESTALCLACCGRDAESEAPLAASLALARSLGARRYECILLFCLATVDLNAGRRVACARATDEALAIARETGMGFCGPLVLGMKRMLAADPVERARHAAEAEAVLAEGALAHCHVHYHRLAIEDALGHGEWSLVARHADALATFTRDEPLRYTDLLIARARALARVGMQPDDAPARTEVARLVDTFRDAGWRMAWPEWATRGTTAG
jgi:hypothetical protein